MDIKKNIEQEEVIQTIEGQLIVIACPGSGKTTTLVRRIHHMVTECQIPSEHILMVTFSNAAAKEMKERYQKTYGADEVTFSTIHSMCFAILRKFAGYNYQDLLTDQREFFYNKLRGNKQINDKEEFINGLLTEISVIKNNRILLEDYYPKCCNDKYLFDDLYEAYEEYKRKMSLIDFDDMLLLAYKTMKEDKECLAWMREKYQYIQVDEYQDTNYVQRDIIYLLAGGNGNLAVVGDDDQSIYGFRGARPQIMLDFKKEYPDAAEIRLSTNYRSCKEIIHAADSVIQKNKNRFSKEFLGFKKDQGVLKYIACDTREHEVAKVSMAIKKLVSAGEKEEDIAVLYRTNAQAEAIANALLTAKIPFHSNEKIPSRYDHWIFEDIQAFYALANGKSKNPKKDLAKVLNHPNRFLLDTAYYQAGLDEKKMRSVAFKSTKESWKIQNALDQISDFFYALRRLEGLSPSKFLKVMVSGALNYLTYLKEYAKFRNMDVAELKEIWDQFTEDAGKYDDWHEWGVYINRYKMAIRESTKGKKGVTLSTMHSAKGLEWKHVFIIDCVEGTCPYRKEGTDTDLEEERRLFYVAMTRAKDYLYLYSYDTKANKHINPSPYIRDASR